MLQYSIKVTVFYKNMVNWVMLDVVSEFCEFTV